MKELLDPTISALSETSRILTQAEEHQLLAQFNNTKVAYPGD